jgi:hypothetical protein
LQYSIDGEKAAARLKDIGDGRPAGQWRMRARCSIICRSALKASSLVFACVRACACQGPALLRVDLWTDLLKDLGLL